MSATRTTILGGPRNPERAHFNIRVGDQLYTNVMLDPSDQPAVLVLRTDRDHVYEVPAAAVRMMTKVGKS